MREWMSEWVNEWVNEWMSEWVGEWMSEWMIAQVILPDLLWLDVPDFGDNVAYPLATRGPSLHLGEGVVVGRHVGYHRFLVRSEGRQNNMKVNELNEWIADIAYAGI